MRKYPETSLLCTWWYNVYLIPNEQLVVITVIIIIKENIEYLIYLLFV